MKNKLKVCIAPLDWGLGHATRMIPLARAFKASGFDLFFAGNKAVLHVLMDAFPDTPYTEIPGYEPGYSNDAHMILKMAAQTPRFFKLISNEKHIADSIRQKHSIDLIVSDNRYGFLSPKAFNIFITHQLNILMPPQGMLFQPIINYLNKSYIKKFDCCWVPDTHGNESLAGKLSKPINTGKPIEYIGHLSRFSHKSEHKKQLNYKVLGIVSGPEPQRTLFQNLLVDFLFSQPWQSVIAGGKPEGDAFRNENCEFVPFMNEETLFEALQSCEVVLSRPGYSTLMDLYGSGKKAVFVPTPGQTEQLYLAKKLQKLGIAPYSLQQNCQLEIPFSELDQYKGFELKEQENQSERLKKVIEKLKVLPEFIKKVSV